MGATAVAVHGGDGGGGDGGGGEGGGGEGGGEGGGGDGGGGDGGWRRRVARVAVMVEADRAGARVGAGCCVRARANLRRR